MTKRASLPLPLDEALIFYLTNFKKEWRKEKDENETAIYRRVEEDAS